MTNLAVFLRKQVAWFLSRPESDEGFRQVIVQLSQRGLRMAGGLGLVIVLLYLLAYILAGRIPSVQYSLAGPRVVLWDKIAIVLLSLSAIALSYSRSGPEYGRLLAGVLLTAMGMASAFDDALNGDTTFTSAWMAVFYLAGVGTMPFRAWHSILTGISITLGCGFAILMGSYVTGGYVAEQWISGLGWSSLVFLSVVTLLGAGISTLVYRNRYEAYLYRVQIENVRNQLQEQTHRLEDTDRLKGRFFANLSHEFRTPLTLLLGPIDDTLHGRYGSVSKRLGTQLELARRNGRRLETLINQLLDLSRLEAGRMEINTSPIELISFVRTLKASYSSLAERRSIDLSFHAEPEVLYVCLDRDKVEKIIVNLLSNALKFTSERGKVRVSIAESTNNSVIITVRDTGPGISPDDIDLVFDRFYRVGNSESNIQIGSGIGLALARELAELHGGTLTVKSNEGFGSSFLLSLPKGDPCPEDNRLPDTDSDDDEPEWIEFESSEDDKVDPVAADAPLVLLVDDNDDVRSYLRTHIEEHYRTVEAVDGQDALEKIAEEVPALVVTDLMMPRVDGHELCRRIKENAETSHIPVVIVTARASEASLHEGLHAGADDYLLKPFNAHELMLRVENLIEIRRRLRKRFSSEFEIRPTGISVRSSEIVFLERVRKIVEEHLGDTNFSVEWLASEVGISPRQLQRRLRRSTSLSAGGFIRSMRLECAAELLKGRAGSVSEIAYRVGFRDANHFSRLFKQTFGVSPSEVPE